MLILPEVDKEQALKFANKLRNTISNYPFKDVKKVTVSVGVTIFHKEDEKEALLKRVDNALYQAKDEGRDTVRLQ